MFGRPSNGNRPLVRRDEPFTLERVEMLSDGHGREAKPLGERRRMHGALCFQELHDGTPGRLPAHGYFLKYLIYKVKPAR
jgi:hypothetical protein